MPRRFEYRISFLGILYADEFELKFYHINVNVASFKSYLNYVTSSFSNISF